MIDMAEIEEMRERGLSYRQIGNKLGISHNMVCHYCHEHGIVGPNDFSRPSKKYPPEIDAHILQMREQGIGYRQIAAELDAPETSIRNRMRTMARRELLEEAA
ncbi:hypothetical protein [Sphingorhabdus sp. SMR4y]|uniref:hypothetical protein n=1 Tax=Sphingorhabdus sp. SMR4y TaxID=2584094 RepID=UPI000B5C2D4F|nr:hypothetical protein [Sphingorhabdus sp. SMR4y]ASK88501.1 helix-turn-helix domain protein [Sphingorhabdus sp. SMR4y]